MNSDFHPRVVVISGPSGVGKSTIIHGAMEQIPAVQLSVSFTTRAKRESEQEGRDYSFIERDTFKTKIAEGEYLEWAEVFGNFYGTGKTAVQELLDGGNHTLLDVDTKGALSIKAICRGVVFVFIRPPSLEDLEKRLRGRGSETEESLATRLARAESEMAKAGEYDHIITNDDPVRATEQLAAIFREAEMHAVPFEIAGERQTSQAAAFTAEDEAGGGAGRSEAMADNMADNLVRALTEKLSPALRGEMVSLIGDHLRAVLNRELNALVRETLQAYRSRKS